MSKAKFILSKKKLINQVKTLEKLGLKISYSFKTNREVGKILQEISNVNFSIHLKEEIEEIKDKSKIWFFTQAETMGELGEIYEKGIRNFVIDNEKDLDIILDLGESISGKINISLRMIAFPQGDPGARSAPGNWYLWSRSSRNYK